MLAGWAMSWFGQVKLAETKGVPSFQLPFAEMIMFYFPCWFERNLSLPETGNMFDTCSRGLNQMEANNHGGGQKASPKGKWSSIILLSASVIVGGRVVFGNPATVHATAMSFNKEPTHKWLLDMNAHGIPMFIKIMLQRTDLTQVSQSASQQH